MVKLNGHIAPRVACVRPSPTAAVSDKLRALRAVGLYVNVTQRVDRSIPCDFIVRHWNKSEYVRPYPGSRHC